MYEPQEVTQPVEMLERCSSEAVSRRERPGASPVRKAQQDRCEVRGRGRPRKYTDAERKQRHVECVMKHRRSHLTEYNKYHREYYHRRKNG